MCSSMHAHMQTKPNETDENVLGAHVDVNGVGARWNEDTAHMTFEWKEPKQKKME